jgi:hypothetical protein
VKEPQSRQATYVSDSDRFVANWLIERITSLPDDVHEKLTERLAIKEENA